MKKRFAFCALLALTLAGCHDENEIGSSCSPDSFMTYCNGDKLVYCGGEDVYTNGKGKITEFNCVDNGLGSYNSHPALNESADCIDRFLCDEAGKTWFEESKCEIDDYNKPGMYNRVCVDDELGRHWSNYHKVADCEGACIPGDTKCFVEGDDCTGYPNFDLGCHGNDFYFCDKDYSKVAPSSIVRIRHCKSDEMCIQVDGNDASSDYYCAQSCTTLGEEIERCEDDATALSNFVCAETNYGNYYVKPLHAASLSLDLICDGSKYIDNPRNNSCNPETDHASCVNNQALNCVQPNGENAPSWNYQNCGDKSNVSRYGLCQIISEQAICLSMCSKKGEQRTSIEFGAMHDRFPHDSIVTYECREIDGNLYDYPTNIKECPNGFNEARTDCK